MSKKRLSKKVLQEDREAFAALKNIAGYNPSNPAYSLANAETVFAAMDSKQTIEVQKQTEADGASDDAAEGEYDAHDMVLGFKTQVKAQYGENSNEYQSLGMKKKSEYKRGGRRKPSNNGATT